MNFYTASSLALHEASTDRRVWMDWVRSPRDPQMSALVWREIKRANLSAAEALGRAISHAGLAKVDPDPAVAALVAQARQYLPSLASAFEKDSAVMRITPLIAELAIRHDPQVEQQLERQFTALWVSSGDIAKKAVRTFLEALDAATETVPDTRRTQLLAELAQIAFSAHLLVVTAWLSLALLEPESEEGLRCSSGDMRGPWYFESDVPIGPGEELEWSVYASVNAAILSFAESFAEDASERFDMTAPPPAALIPFITIDAPLAHQIASEDVQRFYEFDADETLEGLVNRDSRTEAMEALLAEMHANREEHDNLYYDSDEDESDVSQARIQYLDQVFETLAVQGKELLAEAEREELQTQILANPVGYFADMGTESLGALEALHLTINYAGYSAQEMASDPRFVNDSLDSVDGRPLELMFGLVAYGEN